MLRTAWARRPRGGSDRAWLTRAGDEGDLASAGTTRTVASSLRSRIPSRRAKTEASTTTPEDRRPRLSSSAERPTAGLARTVRGATRAELLELVGCPLHDMDYLRIPFTSGPGADDVAGCEDRH